MKASLFVSAVLVMAACVSTLGETVSAPVSVQLTAYNDNFALVKETRTVNLKKGNNSIRVEDVAAQIDPTSIFFKSLTAPNSVSILEQNYQYDLITPENILKKSIGQHVTFTQYTANGKACKVSGKLASPQSYMSSLGYMTSSGPVLRADDGSIVLNPLGQVTVKKMPEGLVSKPTLNWLLESNQAGKHNSEISYITNGVNWKADYIALVNKTDSKFDLTGWVTLNNQSGASYKNTKLTLMAGDVRRVKEDQQSGYRNGMMGGMGGMMGPAAPQFQEKGFFEYHMYSMQRPTTILDKETKQLSLLNAFGVPTKKIYVYDGRRSWWLSWWRDDRTDYRPGGGYDTSNYHKVNVVLETKNSKENHLGIPLPKGKIRVYKLDESGSQQFIGEDTIDHTPRDERIRLYVGDAFDIVGDYKRTDFKDFVNAIEEAFEVRVRNHKDRPVDVSVVDHVWGDWTVIEKSHNFNKVDGHTIEFPVSVPANGETVVTYRIRVVWDRPRNW